MSLPRLELNSAAAVVQIAKAVKKEMSLRLSTFKYWTDWTLTLQYITDKSHRFKVYVANRVAEILEYTDTADWQHFDGEMNLADMCTRGLMDRANLLQWDKQRKSWLLGPDLLTEKHQASNIVTDEIDKDNPEIKKDITGSRNFEQAALFTV